MDKIDLNNFRVVKSGNSDHDLNYINDILHAIVRRLGEGTGVIDGIKSVSSDSTIRIEGDANNPVLSALPVLARANAYTDEAIASLPATGVQSVGATSPLASSGGTNPVISMTASGVDAGTVTFPSSITVDVYGRVTSATGGTAPVATSWGEIVGDINNQADLKDALDLKASISDLATVATSGSYNDLSNKPVIPDVPVLSVNGKVGDVVIDKADVGLTAVDNTSDANKPVSIATQNALDGKADKASLAVVATSGSYNDLSDRPVIPAVPVQSVNGKVGDVVLDKSDVGLSDVDNTSDADKPVSSATQAALVLKADKDSLAEVATTGKYDDLIDKPSIPAAQVPSDWNATVGVSRILNRPTLSTVATTGDYNDLNNKPVIPEIPVLSVNGKTGAVVINKGDVGLSNVDNTSDINKPVSSATQDALDLKADISSLAAVATSGDYNDLSNVPPIPAAQVPSDWAATTGVSRILNKPTTLAGYGITDAINVSEKGSSNGVATLGPDGKLSTAQVPPLAITEPNVVDSEAEQLALDVQIGDVAVRTDLSRTYINSTGNNVSMDDWVEMLSPPNAVVSVNGKVGAVVLGKGDVGLGNVDNTSDLSKPVSSATQAALDDKANISDLSEVAFSGSYDDLVDKPVIPDVPVLSVNGRTGEVVLDKSDVGLSNVDNTSDLAKPISTATQGALNSKIESLTGMSPIGVGGAGTVRTITHVDSGATAGTYTNPTVSVNSTGHVTSISSGPGPAPLVWGNILGRITDQTDLQAALDGKVSSVTGSAPINVAGLGNNLHVSHANSGVTEGSYSYPSSISVNTQGHVTRVLSGSTPISTITALSPISASGTGTSRSISHANSGVSAGTYTNATITVNASGHVTSASSGPAASAIWGSIGGILSNQTDLQNALNTKASLTVANTWSQPQSVVLSANDRVYFRTNMGSLDPNVNNGGAVYFGVGTTTATTPTAAIETNWGGGTEPQMHIGVVRGGKNAWASFYSSSGLGKGITLGHGEDTWLNLYNTGAQFARPISAPSVSVTGGTANQVMNANGTLRNITIAVTNPTGIPQTGAIWFRV